MELLNDKARAVKIVLVQPNKKYQIWSGVPDVLNTQDFHLFPPMGLMYLSASLKKRSSHEVKVLDAFLHNMERPQIRDYLAAESPRAVGVYASTHNLYDSMEAVRAAKEANPQIHVIMGGPHTWSYPEEAIALEGVDAVYRGDAEFALVEWLDALEKGSPLDSIPGFFFKRDGEVVRNAPRENIENLDEVPFPDRTCVDLDRYFTPAQGRTRVTTLIGSRGCPHHCLYCSCRKDYRERSIRNIVDEIEELATKWSIEEIALLDDNFNLRTGRIEEFCREILSRGLKVRWAFKGNCNATTPEMLKLARKAGCVRIHYGVETNADEGYRALRKRGDIASIKQSIAWTRKAGIKAVAYMMIGCPHEESIDDVLKNVKFIRELKPDFVIYSVFSPYPDAPSFEEGARLGFWPADAWKGFLLNPTREYDVPTVWNQKISKEDLMKAMKILYRDFYFSPSTVLRTIASIESWAGLKRIFQGGLCLLRLLRINKPARHF
jgi:radical SAM superfamily enzyme YgiQ (UPF0313 family)